MANKTRRYPLEMGNGFKVNNVQELKENFYLPLVVVYFKNGKLVPWLRDRYEEELADKVDALQKEDSNVAEKLCNIFGVKYDAESVSDMESIVKRERKRNLLKEVTMDQKVIDAVDQVAFTQGDLDDLLNENQTEIYLCGERFLIPLAKSGVKYYGINTPIVIIDSKEEVDWKEKNIEFTDVEFDEAYQKILSDRKPINRKLKRLREYTTDTWFEKVINKVAFTQNNLEHFLDEGQTEIYLCGEKFSIPLERKGIHYYGINNPVVEIDSDKEVNWAERDISLINVSFDAQYQQVLRTAEQSREALIERRKSRPLIIKGDTTGVYLVTSTVCSNAVDASYAENTIYYITKEDRGCKLHVFDIDKQTENIKITDTTKLTEGKILDCSDDWFVYKRNEFSLYIYNRQENWLKGVNVKNGVSNGVIIGEYVFFCDKEDSLMKMNLKELRNSQISIQKVRATKEGKIVGGAQSKALMKEQGQLIAFYSAKQSIYFVKIKADTDCVVDCACLHRDDINFDFGSVYDMGKVYCFGKNPRNQEELLLYCYDISTQKIQVLDIIKIHSNTRGSLSDAEYKVNYELDNHILNYRVYENGENLFGGVFGGGNYTTLIRTNTIMFN